MGVNVTQSKALQYDVVVKDQREDSKKAQAALMKAYHWDTISRIAFRGVLLVFFLGFLSWQNIYVYKVVSNVLFSETINYDISDVEMLLQILIGGTIAQTVAIVAIMVRWVFTDIDYKNSPLNGS